MRARLVSGTKAVSIEGVDAISTGEMTCRCAHPSPCRNILLDCLAIESLGALEHHFEPVILPAGYKCASQNKQIENVYFPTCGIVGHVAGGCEAQVDAGIYGRDGVSGIPLVFGLDRSPHDDVVQVAGKALRVPADLVLDLMQRDTALRGLLLHFAHCLALQASFSALSSLSDDVRQRLARLLIMCLDRIDGHELLLTHGFLATTLGVRRASVTSAMHHLEGDRLIKATRGRVHIRSREALTAIAGPNYGVAEREYDRLFARRTSVPAVGGRAG